MAAAGAEHAEEACAPVSLLSAVRLAGNADSVEACPLSGGGPPLVAVATYTLDEGEGKGRGRAFPLGGSGDGGTSIPPLLEGSM